MAGQDRVYRPVPGLSRKEEEKQLQMIIRVAQENLTKVETKIREMSDEVYEMYELLETEESEAKQALTLLHTAKSQLQESKRELIRCRKARKKPYFGRIDFKDPRQKKEESYYVGRVGISENTTDPVVIDWRAPLASVYYENHIGRCSYTVKNEGTFEIDLKRKRTYEIENDRLKDFFDSDVVANDELLTKYLAKNKTAVLGEIIATIQKEQNEVIRRSSRRNLIVQGAAGSGKTTVAMHRISYILYNFEEDFRPEDFYIIGSNRILLNYITSVLPDLDVYGISQMTMEQLFVRLLYEDWDPLKFTVRPVDQKDPAACVKGSSQWFSDLETFCRIYEETEIPSDEVQLEKSGVLLMDEEMIRDYLKQHPKMSMQAKINMLNEILMSKLENELAGKGVSYTPEEKKELFRLYRRHFGKKTWRGSIFKLYRQFLENQKEQGQRIPLKENEFDLYDLAALAYLYKRIKETDGIREASHVVIDEAQDFGMMAYRSLEYCLRGCTYTIMGDVCQNISFGYGLGDWEELKKLILPEDGAGFCLLQKSYRNTVEISAFAEEILRHGTFAVYPVNPISRHGNPVSVKCCEDEDEMVLETRKSIEKWLQEGRETIAVICRDEKEASELRMRLGDKLPIEDSDPDTADFTKGIMVLPVEYTKGLEFDAVLLYHPSAGRYPAEDRHVKLLYVAATRALHELAVVHQGDLTDLIAKPVSEKTKMRLIEKEVPGAAPKDQERVAAAPRVPEKEEQTKGCFIQERENRADVKKNFSSKTRASWPVNPSTHHFGECPPVEILRPKGHGQIDCSIQGIKKTKSCLDLASRYGVLRITPLQEDIIRIQFKKDPTPRFRPGFWDYSPKARPEWIARAGKNLIEAATAKAAVRIDKRTGALQFLDRLGKQLLAEQAGLPRQIEAGPLSQTWTYFDWPEKEKLFAKGVLAEELERMNRKARYIHFGGKKMRMPLLLSEYGYGIGVAAEQSVICCTLPMYGLYLYTDGTDQIDYYFLYGGDRKKTLELYKSVEGR